MGNHDEFDLDVRLGSGASQAGPPQLPGGAGGGAATETCHTCPTCDTCPEGCGTDLTQCNQQTCGTCDTQCGQQTCVD